MNLTTGLEQIAENLFITKPQLVKANAESIRLGFNNNLTGSLDDLPDQRYIVRLAFRHVGWNGSDRDNINYRLMLYVWTKMYNDPTLGNADMIGPLLLDVTGDVYAKLCKQTERMKRRNNVE